MPATSYRATRWLFLRLLGCVCLIAFLSLSVEIRGLIGRDGILPAANLFKAMAAEPGRYRELPTLCWWIGAGDSALLGLCAAGAVLAVLLICNIAPALMLVGIWMTYLSLCVAGQEFLSFQWDILLLETVCFSVFLAPWKLWPRIATEGEPSPVGVLLIRWLLFRLMFLSGVVKLASGDPTWRNCTALNFHYWTQPLPTWVAWTMHQLPPWTKVGSMGFMWLAELVLPCFVFGPRPLRYVAFVGIVTLQCLIALTGNYGFFNLLTIVLGVVVLDDSFLRRLWRPLDVSISLPYQWSRPRIALAIVGIALAILAGFAGLQRTVGWSTEPFASALAWAEPFRTLNSYGLFAVMTTERDEIEIQGSRDGKTWQTYAFRYKPGDPHRRPAFIAPHMPRLDWQMWFAALGNYQDNDWMLQFMNKLLEGSAPVLNLLASDPFPGSPPKYVRATRWRYQFTKAGEKDWWSREPIAPYMPVVTREGGKLVAVRVNGK